MEMEDDLYVKAKQEIRLLNKQIRSIMPNIDRLIDAEKVSISEVKEGALDGKAIRRVIIILRSTGCKWSLEEHGGCTMCGHLTGTARGNMISSNIYCKQFDEEMSKYNFEDYPMLCLYNSGSFLNTDEIPIEAQDYMLKKINQTNGIKRLIIESRPEYITDSALDRINNICNDIDVEIGVGLETVKEDNRDLCLNKGLIKDDYTLLANRTKRFAHIKLLAYILIKPPFSTEQEGIDDAIESVKFAFEIGFDIVSLEPVSVQDFTLTSFLHEAKYFRPPWIWSVIEVVKQTYNLGFVRIGGFEFFPIPKIFTNNCDKCNEKMIKAIQQFNKNYDYSVFEGLACNCMEEWKYDLSEKSSSLPQRILSILDKIDKNEILVKMKMNYDVRGPHSSTIHSIIFSSCSGYHILIK
jgi:radical SAM enzyme (TIGR01210 family)